MAMDPGLFVADRQQGLELRRFCFAVDDGGGDVAESGFFEQIHQLRFAEAEALVGIELARLFEAVPGQIQNGDAAAGAQDARGLLHGLLGMQCVVQRLRKEDQVYRSSVDGRLFHVAEAEIDVLDAVTGGLFAPEVKHAGG